MPVDEYGYSTCNSYYHTGMLSSTLMNIWKPIVIESLDIYSIDMFLNCIFFSMKSD